MYGNYDPGENLAVAADCGRRAGDFRHCVSGDRGEKEEERYRSAARGRPLLPENRGERRGSERPLQSRPLYERGRKLKHDLRILTG